jgi:hypothetical protein
MNFAYDSNMNVALRCAVVCLVLLASTQTLAQSRCVVRGPLPSVDAVRVPIAGADAHVLDVEDTDAEAILPEAPGGPTSLTLTGALRIEGAAVNVPFALRGTTSAAGGVARIAASAPLERVRATPGGSAVFDAVLAHAVLARDVEVPCEALRPGPIEASETPSIGDRALDANPGDGHWWTHVNPTMRVFVQRGGTGASVLVSFARRDAQWTPTATLRRLQSVGSWVHVLLAERDGVIEGWVPRGELRALPSGPESGGSDGSACSGCGGGVPVPVGAGDVLGPATIAPGTGVFASPDGVRWATVLRPDGYVAWHRRGEAWVNVLTIPGVYEHGRCRQNFRRAFVPRSAVRFVTVPDAGRTPEAARTMHR